MRNVCINYYGIRGHEKEVLIYLESVEGRQRLFPKVDLS